MRKREEKVRWGGKEKGAEPCRYIPGLGFLELRLSDGSRKHEASMWAYLTGGEPTRHAERDIRRRK
jgi:hypothetical protein